MTRDDISSEEGRRPRGEITRRATRQPTVWAWVGRRAPTDQRAAGYRLMRRPALAEIVGDGRPWTVLMISELSMPWR
jgi:hypothetical protein